MENTILKAENITKTFISGNERLEVLKNVDLEVKAGEWVCILGPSGTGKSTLLHILGGLDLPDAGSVMVNHTNLQSINHQQLSDIRNKHIGFVFQFHHLLPEFNVLENVAMPLFIAGLNHQQAFTQAEHALQDIGFWERRFSRTTELSGGEKQKVALARALVTNPIIVLADEPTGNLDVTNTESLLVTLQRINQEKKVTILTVTHNQHVVDYATRKFWLKNGKLSENSK
ncbi:MAG: ABC transporter ATP-binding protein [Candidatus Latescibacteria bacterium]|nr:ABC transporter ATP-binding protein [Candidatus Latescibacterota bacterium]